MLNEKQIKSIELLIDGNYGIQEIADAVGVHRSTIHGWRTRNEEYQEEYKKRLQAKTQAVSQKFNERLDVAVESLYDIITNPDVATRERKDAAIYWINRVAGTPTSRTEINDSTKDNQSISEQDLLADLEELEEDNNVVELKKKAE